MPKTGADVLHDTFVGYGVKYVFGMDSPETFYEAVEKNKRAIKPITIHQETMGALMATGYSQVSSKPSVCFGDHGAGATNLVTGIAEAWKSSIPVIAITGGIPESLERKNAAQDVEQVELFRPISKLVIDVMSPDKMSETVRLAFRVATSGRPGPVVLNIRPEALSEESSDKVIVESDFNKVPAIRIAPEQSRVSEAARALLAAERPCIIAGGGVLTSQAMVELKDLAELLLIPVATTIMGKGAFLESHPLSLGPVGAYVSGPLGHGKVANKIIQESDLVLLVGTRTDEMSTIGWRFPTQSSRIIHIDIDPTEIGRNYKTEIGIVSDAKLGLRALCDVISVQGKKQSQAKDSRAAQIVKLRQEWQRANDESITRFSGSTIRSVDLYNVMKEFVDHNSIVASDASQCSAWAASHLQALSAGRCFLQPRGLGALGMALPLALGAKLAAPQKKVFCFDGDGGFMVGQVQELETALRYGLDVVVFVLNNQTLAGNSLIEEVLWNSYDHEIHFTNVDFAKVAQGFGCWGKSVEKTSEIRDTIKEALSAGKPALIDVKLAFATKEAIKDQMSVFSLGIWGGEL